MDFHIFVRSVRSHLKDDFIISVTELNRISYLNKDRFIFFVDLGNCSQISQVLASHLQAESVHCIYLIGILQVNEVIDTDSLTHCCCIKRPCILFIIIR